MNLIDKLTMLNIAVTDADKAKKFYEDTLGCKVADDKNFGDKRWITLTLPGNNVTVTLSTVHEGYMKPGTMKLYFSSPDVENSLKELQAKGIKPVHEGNDWGSWGDPNKKGEKWFEITDPDGNHLLITPA
jgi:catechol 2,3-dioxygenase-like lactoylglutathione lyase family enzyme